MDTTVASEPIDRRCATRRRLPEEHGILLARVRPGHKAIILDVSTRGALIETGHRVLPGAPIELHVQRQHGATTIRGLVVRCAVACVGSSTVRYRAAVAFEGELSGVGAAGKGYSAPDGNHESRVTRVDPTP